MVKEGADFSKGEKNPGTLPESKYDSIHLKREDVGDLRVTKGKTSGASTGDAHVCLPLFQVSLNMSLVGLSPRIEFIARAVTRGEC